MKSRTARRVAARYRWDRLKVSFWFVPTVMGLGAVVLAWVMYALDVRIPNEELQNSHFVLAGSPADLRTYLLGIAGTVLGTAGVVFTLLTLPLSTVAAQYGSRLLRVYLGDRTTQFVLAMFVATFVYCIAAALSIPPADVQAEGPVLTATVGVYLMLATFATLILLVQHTSTTLQAPNIAAAAGAELRAVVRAEVTNDEGGGSGLETRPGFQGGPDALTETEGYPIRAMSAGYIQYIEPDIMLTLASEKDLVMRLSHKPGRYVGPGAVLAMVWPAVRVDEQLAGRIRRAFQIGNGRIPTQDIEYGVNQLTEMAVRAMSPAINDPFTAMTCLDHMGDGLASFLRKGRLDTHFYDQDGKLRLVLERATFADLLGAAFDMLRHASCDNTRVLLHMLEVLDTIGREAKAPEARQLLLCHVQLIQAESQAGELIEQDRQAIKVRCQALQTKLQGAA
jgi:uncharacterized membrane protein